MGHQPETGSKKRAVCHCLNVRRAGQAVTGIYDRHLAPSGLSISQYSILSYLRSLGQVSVSVLAGEMRLDRTTLVRNLKPLEQQGLVTDVSPSKRSRKLELTGAGLDCLRATRVMWKAAQQELEDTLGEEGLAALAEVLEKIGD